MEYWCVEISKVEGGREGGERERNKTENVLQNSNTTQWEASHFFLHSSLSLWYSAFRLHL